MNNRYCREIKDTIKSACSDHQKKRIQNIQIKHSPPGFVIIYSNMQILNLLPGSKRGIKIRFTELFYINSINIFVLYKYSSNALLWNRYVTFVTPGTGRTSRLLNPRVETKDQVRIPLLISEVVVEETHSIILSVLLAKSWRKDDHFCSMNWSMNSFCSASTLERASYSILYLSKSRTGGLRGAFCAHTANMYAVWLLHLAPETRKGHNMHQCTFPAASSSLRSEPVAAAAEPLVVLQLISADF